MEDHHVDRLGVEVQQCMKLTSTNSSIGFITLVFSAHSFIPRGTCRGDRSSPRRLDVNACENYNFDDSSFD